ncbi:scavenger receptor class A member 5-like [Macrobrachium nipponense]|uniref:scavenger receptor class A member 5-like n=1 Tax=Macrobrachium nipponense TaxID=159736 RepID=UPI0030C80C15
MLDVLSGILLVRSAKITSEIDALDVETLETLNETEKAKEKFRDLKARLLNLNPEYISDIDDAAHERHLRTLFPAGYSGCSCSDLAAIAAQITLFEDDVRGLDDLQNKVDLIATAVKQLGAWVNSGVKGPQGPQGLPGPQGVTGQQGDSGDAGPDTVMTREGIPGPQGPSGPSGPSGVKGERGDCIKGQKGTQGKKGEPGVGLPGMRGTPGPQGVPGKAAPNLDFSGAKST